MNKIEVITAIRMMLSKSNLVTVRESDSNNPSGVDIKVSGEKLVSKLKSLKQLPGSILVKDVGVFKVADCPANLISAGSKKYDRERMQNKVVVITGGAQGFGAGIAEEFFNEGANIIIADLNIEVGRDLVNKLNAKSTANEAYFVQADVSDLSSVENLVAETLAYFGGLDVMISNAGILRAGGLDEMTPETFALMTKVNYAGYFNCAKASAEVMKFQHKYAKTRYFDILQINSKSGLKGSNKNFAYAGGKFGGIGLTQSFALELMPFNIKVNSICPGNFFDGPLWSHPETGLFVQYLNAGKVPGAKNIEEVKKFYENQVPAGRGCSTLDVARAAFYAIEQEYETGQAIPVTGGQNMLH